MYGHLSEDGQVLFLLSPSCASLTGGYAHLATPWQRTYSIIFQTYRQQFEKI